MAILNYTTKINAEKTIMEIQKILVAHGAEKITTDYQAQKAIAVTFCLRLNGQIVGYALPANHVGVLKSMQNSRKVPRAFCNEEQATRVAWRIVKVWIEAQCAIVEAHVADLTEVFLPYAITNNGDTVYQRLKQQPQLLLHSGT